MSISDCEDQFSYFILSVVFIEVYDFCLEWFKKA